MLNQRKKSLAYSSELRALDQPKDCKLMYFTPIPSESVAKIIPQYKIVRITDDIMNPIAKHLGLLVVCVTCLLKTKENVNNNSSTAQYFI